MISAASATLECSTVRDERVADVDHVIASERERLAEP
jgi:hypothetical protein